MKRVMAVGIVNIDLIYTTPKLPSVEDRHTTVSSRRYHHRPHPTGWRSHVAELSTNSGPLPRRGPCGINALGDDKHRAGHQARVGFPARRPHLNRADPQSTQEMPCQTSIPRRPILGCVRSAAVSRGASGDDEHQSRPSRSFR